MAGGNRSFYGARILLVGSLGIIVLLRLTSGASLSSDNDEELPGNDDFKNEAIVRLSQVFGIERLPVHTHHRSPPQYMLDLYNTVAYSDGVTKVRSPYGSDVVRGLPDRDNVHQMHFFFNVSYVNPHEKVVEAEFHLFKLRPRPSGASVQQPRGVHLIEIRLYEVLDETRMYSPEGTRLINYRRVSAHRHGWEVFKVKDTVQRWVNYSDSNLGFLVTATSLSGEHINGSYVRFAQRSEHHDSKQPVLVVFTKKKKVPTATLR